MSRTYDLVHDGAAVTGWRVGSFVRGHRVVSEGELVAPARGEAVRFRETLASN